MVKKIAVIALLACSASAAAQDIYFGAGISRNDLSYFNTATGFQFFAGVPLPATIGSGGTAIEIGYMDSGEFEACGLFGGACATTRATGLWVTGVGSWRVGRQVNFLGRVGVDLGDDDGLMVGLGLGYVLDRNMELRGEYVIRDHIDSWQVNLVYRP